MVAGPSDSSEQYHILLSVDAMAWFAGAAASTTEPALRAQVADLQSALPLFNQTQLTRPAVPSELQEQATQQAALIDRFRSKLDDGIAMRNTIQDRLAHMTLRAEAESQRADDNRTLLDEHRVVFARMAAASPSSPPLPTPRPTSNTIKTPDPPSFSKGRPQYRSFRAKLKKLRGDGNRFRDDDHRLGYAMGLLECDAYAIAHPLCKNGTIRTVDELVPVVSLDFGYLWAWTELPSSIVPRQKNVQSMAFAAPLRST